MRHWNFILILFNKAFQTCFYSTYEALKHQVCSLLPPDDVGFLLYLWGIETFQIPQFFIKKKKFLLYLWGIETA